MTRLTRPIAVAAVVTAAAVLLAASPTSPASPSSDAARAAELLAADRALGAAAASLPLADGLAAAFADGVVMLSRGRLVVGRDAARDSLRALPASDSSRLQWVPVRAGIAADGAHGFTYGYTTLARPDGTTIPGKYVAYWEKGADGWRIAAYKRVPRPAGEVALAVRIPSLPHASVPRGATVALRDEAMASLRAAEIAFSDDANATSIGDAFRRFGAPDAVNVGGPRDTSFVLGNEAIAASVAAGTAGAGTLAWAPDLVRVSGTGDLGVSLGYITIHAPASAKRPEARVAYLTVWRRDRPDGPWRYVAE